MNYAFSFVSSLKISFAFLMNDSLDCLWPSNDNFFYQKILTFRSIDLNVFHSDVLNDFEWFPESGNELGFTVNGQATFVLYSFRHSTWTLFVEAKINGGIFTKLSKIDHLTFFFSNKCDWWGEINRIESLNGNYSQQLRLKSVQHRPEWTDWTKNY